MQPTPSDPSRVDSLRRQSLRSLVLAPRGWPDAAWRSTRRFAERDLSRAAPRLAHVREVVRQAAALLEVACPRDVAVPWQAAEEARTADVAWELLLDRAEKLGPRPAAALLLAAETGVAGAHPGIAAALEGMPRKFETPAAALLPVARKPTRSRNLVMAAGLMLLIAGVCARTARAHGESSTSKEEGWRGAK